MTLLSRNIWSFLCLINTVWVLIKLTAFTFSRVYFESLVLIGSEIDLALGFTKVTFVLIHIVDFCQIVDTAINLFLCSGAITYLLTVILHA